MKPKAIIFFGASGSGKGTQIEKLSNYLKEIDPSREVLHVQTGSILRNFIKNNSSHTRDLTRSTLDGGRLLPVFVAIWAWTNYLIENFTGDEHIVFDGAARRAEEAPIVDSAMELFGRSDLGVVYIKVSDEWATKRLMERGREDDTPDNIKRRLEWFDKDTKPSIEYLKNQKENKYVEVNGEQSIDEVHADVLKGLFG